MSVFKRYSYIRAIFIGIPFGIVCIIVGTQKFFEIPKDIAELYCEEIMVSSYGMKIIYDDGADSNFNVFYIKTNDKEYYTELGKNIDILEKELPVLLRQTNIIKVWHLDGDNYIKQLSVNNFILIEYSPPYWIAHFFLWLGIITLSTGLVYVIKHPEDFTGRKIYKKKGEPSKTKD